MMMLLLAKRNPCSILRPFFTQQLLSRFISASPTQNQDPKSTLFSVVDYLVTSFGLSHEKAARISKPIAHLKSPENPDAVRRFLSDEGFTESDIKIIVTSFPGLLCSPEGSLETNLGALRDMGLSTSSLTQIIISQPKILQLRSAAPPRIKFWLDFFEGDEAALLKVFKNNRDLIGHDITRNIVPKLSFLKSHGLSTQDVRRILLLVSRFVTYSTNLMEDILNRTKELGFQPDSKMFVHGLQAVSSCSRELLLKKMELLKSSGWSEDEFLSALHKMPGMAWLSENNLRTKMCFLTGEVGCKPSYIASNPGLFLFSLEKRLRPRHHVLQLLDSKGLSGKRRSFYSAMTVSDNKFVETYISPHKEDVAGLLEAYLAAFT